MGSCGPRYLGGGVSRVSAGKRHGGAGRGGHGVTAATTRRRDEGGGILLDNPGVVAQPLEDHALPGKAIRSQSAKTFNLKLVGFLNHDSRRDGLDAGCRAIGQRLFWVAHVDEKVLSSRFWKV